VTVYASHREDRQGAMCFGPTIQFIGGNSRNGKKNPRSERQKFRGESFGQKTCKGMARLGKSTKWERGDGGRYKYEGMVCQTNVRK